MYTYSQQVLNGSGGIFAGLSSIFLYSFYKQHRPFHFAGGFSRIRYTQLNGYLGRFAGFQFHKVFTQCYPAAARPWMSIRFIIFMSAHAVSYPVIQIQPELHFLIRAVGNIYYLRLTISLSQAKGKSRWIHTQVLCIRSQPQVHAGPHYSNEKYFFTHISSIM